MCAIELPPMCKSCMRLLGAMQFAASETCHARAHAAPHMGSARAKPFVRALRGRIFVLIIFTWCVRL